MPNYAQKRRLKQIANLALCLGVALGAVPGAVLEARAELKCFNRYQATFTGICTRSTATIIGCHPPSQAFECDPNISIPPLRPPQDTMRPPQLTSEQPETGPLLYSPPRDTAPAAQPAPQRARAATARPRQRTRPATPAPAAVAPAHAAAAAQEQQTQIQHASVTTEEPAPPNLVVPATPPVAAAPAPQPARETAQTSPPAPSAQTEPQPPARLADSTHPAPSGAGPAGPGAGAPNEFEQLVQAHGASRASTGNEPPQATAPAETPARPAQGTQPAGPALTLRSGALASDGCRLNYENYRVPLGPNCAPLLKECADLRVHGQSVFSSVDGGCESNGPFYTGVDCASPVASPRTGCARLELAAAATTASPSLRAVTRADLNQVVASGALADGSPVTIAHSEFLLAPDSSRSHAHPAQGGSSAARALPQFVGTTRTVYTYPYEAAQAASGAADSAAPSAPAAATPPSASVAASAPPPSTGRRTLVHSQGRSTTYSVDTTPAPPPASPPRLGEGTACAPGSQPPNSAPPQACQLSEQQIREIKQQFPRITPHLTREVSRTRESINATYRPYYEQLDRAGQERLSEVEVLNRQACAQNGNTRAQETCLRTQQGRLERIAFDLKRAEGAAIARVCDADAAAMNAALQLRGSFAEALDNPDLNFCSGRARFTANQCSCMRTVDAETASDTNRFRDGNAFSDMRARFGGPLGRRLRLGAAETSFKQLVANRALRRTAEREARIRDLWIYKGRAFAALAAEPVNVDGLRDAAYNVTRLVEELDGMSTGDGLNFTYQTVFNACPTLGADTVSSLTAAPPPEACAEVTGADTPPPAAPAAGADGAAGTGEPAAE